MVSRPLRIAVMRRMPTQRGFGRMIDGQTCSSVGLALRQLFARAFLSPLVGPLSGVCSPGRRVSTQKEREKPTHETRLERRGVMWRFGLSRDVEQVDTHENDQKAT